MREVIVIGKNYATALGAIRSLGEAGYVTKLVGMNKGTINIASKSKYVTQTAMAELNFDSLFDALEKLRGGSEKILVIPTNDGICKILDDHATQLFQHYIIPNINDKEKELSVFMDKMVQKELAIQYGMKVANGICYNTSEQLSDSEIKGIEYPCFVKPLASANVVVGCKALFAVCNDSAELRKAIDNAAGRNCEKVLIEKYLHIDEELCIYGVAAKDIVYAPACVETFRGGFAEHKGVTIEGKVISASKLGIMADQVVELVKKIGLTGLFCVDILRCGDELYFSEMNLRFGGSGYAVTLAGANLTAALADMVYGLPVDRSLNIQREITFLNERIEFDAFINGYVSEREYKAHMAGKQERFIMNRQDKKPGFEFKKMVFKRITKKRIKKLLGR